MNKLVDYGSDSEEEISLTEEVAYDEPEIVDSFDDDFEKNEEASTSDLLKEPKPPKRPSDEENKSDPSPDESVIDNALEEGMNALKDLNEDIGELDDGTSYSNVDSVGDDLSPNAVLNKIELPPSPDDKCSSEIENRFLWYFERKSNGTDMNAQIKTHKNFKNPALYEFLVQKYNIDEKGTNFNSNIFNPHCFKEDDFFNSLADEQHKLHEKMIKAEAKKTTNIPVAQTITIGKNLESSKVKKSRFSAK